MKSLKTKKKIKRRKKRSRGKGADEAAGERRRNHGNKLPPAERMVARDAV